MTYIASPLNYIGNKFKLLSQIYNIIYDNYDLIIEPFCGSALVSLNTNTKNIILNDTCKYLIDILKYFYNNNYETIEKNVEDIIKKYNFTDTFHNGYSKYPTEKNEGLSRYNKDAFTKLKQDYNINPTIDKLFVLILFGFNQYIRFNNNGIFNVPVGKSDFSKTARKKTEQYIELLSSKNIIFYNNNFDSEELYNNVSNNSLVYLDPPYLITNAPYNSNWNENFEKKLLNFLDYLNSNNINFALSNVIENNGEENIILKNWAKNYNIHFLEKDYKVSNYHRKNKGKTREVLITNF